MIDPSIISAWLCPIIGVIFIIVLLFSKSSNNEQKEWKFTADELTIEATNHNDFQVIWSGDNEACFIGNFGDCDEWCKQHMISDYELSKWSVKSADLRVKLFQ